MLSDIGFFVTDYNSEEQLKIKEEEGLYPPRFNVVISCSPTASQSQTRITFTGAVKEMVFDIPLTPDPLQNCVATGEHSILQQVGKGIYCKANFAVIKKFC